MGCQQGAPSWLIWPQTQPAEPTTPAVEAAPVPLTPEPRHDLTAAERLRQRDVRFTIFMLRVPREHTAAIDKIWNYVRPADEVFDAQTAARLRGNGIRVGVGHDQWWPPIRAALSAVEGVLASRPDPWRIPQRFPLNLELDTEPRDRTLFVLGTDGALSGGTWPQSETALQLTHVIDPVKPDHDRVTLIPLVRREQRGYRDIRTEAGVWRVPREDGRLFVEAGCTVTLGPGEFLVLGPQREGRAAGLIGADLLSSDADGLPYDYHVIIKPDLADEQPGR